MTMGDYVIRVLNSPLLISAAAWDALLAQQLHPTPFMRHAYLAALHTSGAATPATGWTPRFITLWQGDALAAACPLYLKTHSHGEYVFDWAWANAYAEHGLAYYPKALVAVPFTPVPGTRLMAVDAVARKALLQALRDWSRQESLSSLHLLFNSDEDLDTCEDAGLMLRHTVQFHWTNEKKTVRAEPVEALAHPSPVRHAQDRPSSGRTVMPEGYRSFDDFLSSLSQDKRKKIKQERRKVEQAGVSFRHLQGADITPEDWAFFYRCYERTYLEHGNPPYLSPDFFAAMAHAMPENWLLFIAEQDGQPIASSLVALGADADGDKVAYGRYWGALARVDCLHFEACYYQPLAWCIAHGYQRFEGGAQGEHKMARALLPVRSSSAHWLAHPAFAKAVENFLNREGQGVDNYLADLSSRSPLRQAD